MSSPLIRPTGLEPWIGPARVAALRDAGQRLAVRLDGRRLVNLTGDDRGKGGVFEILRSTLPYLRGIGLNVEWLDLPTRPEERPSLEFFHVLAHGVPPSPAWREDLPARARDLHAFAQRAADDLRGVLRPDDVLVLHDTQATPLAGTLTDWSPRTAWHGHIGTTQQHELVDAYWSVLGPALSQPRARIVYRLDFLPEAFRGASIAASPGLDPATEKAKLIDQHEARTALFGAALDAVRWHGNNPAAGALVVAQLSRWDPLKNMAGAVKVFGAIAEELPGTCGVVMGPVAQSDSEKRELTLALAERERLPHPVGSAVYIAEVDDCGTAEHDLAVRTVQSAADVVMQRSLQEGFGLTVTEALWRGRPVVASRVGGIPLQADDSTAVLLDPSSPDQRWTSAIRALLRDAERRTRMGVAAHERIRDGHLVDRQLTTLLNGMLRLVAE